MQILTRTFKLKFKLILFVQLFFSKLFIFTLSLNTYASQSEFLLEETKLQTKKKLEDIRREIHEMKKKLEDLKSENQVNYRKRSEEISILNQVNPGPNFSNKIFLERDQKDTRPFPTVEEKKKIEELESSYRTEREEITRKKNVLITMHRNAQENEKKAEKDIENALKKKPTYIEEEIENSSRAGTKFFKRTDIDNKEASFARTYYGQQDQVASGKALEKYKSLNINHPNIVRIVHAKQHTDGKLEFDHEIMKETLREWIPKIPVKQKIDVAKSVLAQIVTGLADLKAISLSENKQYCHSNLNPENIYFRKDGLVKISILDSIDCISSTREEREKDSKKISESIYTAPESRNSVKPKICGEKNDIWSLGMIMLSTLGLDENQIAKFLKEKKDSEFSKALIPDQHFRELIKRCLHEDPAKRPEIGRLKAEIYALRDNLDNLVDSKNSYSFDDACDGSIPVDTLVNLEKNMRDALVKLKSKVPPNRSSPEIDPLEPVIDYLYDNQQRNSKTWVRKRDIVKDSERYKIFLLNELMPYTNAIKSLIGTE
jgi:serine/threonine protein kinase